MNAARIQEWPLSMHVAAGLLAAAVVFDCDQPQAAAFDAHRDAVRASIERVFDQLFHGRSRALDHLARGDAVHGFWRQTADCLVTER